ncbi:DUF3806 domain-containing protein [Arcanobacterium phocae]|uniref:DUF3806 domain-containing protein n=1 Tax=Arcanobacterium phocae TaxID=131112 RepID=A0A1H2LAD4_9ACTO|nr:DUF3806 domain-containing protein [Arcanobacterium phocae]SDU77997.1 protein of unknown function [Arcanobacterium phocae]
MTSLHVRQLSESEVSQITTNIDIATNQNLTDSVESIDLAARNLRQAQPADLESQLQVLGAALGAIISAQTQMQWAAVTDGIESAIVLIGTVGENTVVVYPFDVVERRWNLDEPKVFTQYVSDVLDSIRVSQNAAESPESE